jgi:alpha/beta superfamily hydrolase
MSVAGNVTFDGTAGRLEGIYRPVDVPRAAAVACHPLPTHGGTMHNKVVFRIAKAFERTGHSVLRFNFRGVGRSQGTFSNGRGEAEDVRAALDWLAARHPGIPLAVAGFSFGSSVGLPVGAADSRVERIVGVGIPIDRFPFEELNRNTRPKLFVQGDRDQYGPLDALRTSLEGVGRPWDLEIIAGADHFFAGRLAELERAIAAWLSASARSTPPA